MSNQTETEMVNNKNFEDPKVPKIKQEKKD